MKLQFRVNCPFKSILSFTAVCLGCSIAGGELFERIVDDNFEHTEPASVHYMQQILEGIGYMHQQNIIHLDLKPENIVCVDTTGTSIKIIDFGLATRIGMKKNMLKKNWCCQ